MRWFNCARIQECPRHEVTMWAMHWQKWCYNVEGTMNYPIVTMKIKEWVIRNIFHWIKHPIESFAPPLMGVLTCHSADFDHFSWGHVCSVIHGNYVMNFYHRIEDVLTPFLVFVIFENIQQICDKLHLKLGILFIKTPCTGCPIKKVIRTKGVNMIRLYTAWGSSEHHCLKKTCRNLPVPSWEFPVQCQDHAHYVKPIMKTY